MRAILLRFFISVFLPVFAILLFGSSSPAETALNRSQQPPSSFTQQSEVSVFIPWSTIQKSFAPEISDTQELKSFDLPDQIYEADGVPVHIKGIQLDVMSQFEPVSIEQGVANLKTKRLIARVRVESITASKIIEQNVGGAIVRVQLDAKCDPFLLFQNDASASIAARMVAQMGAPAAVIDRLDLEWPINSWQVEPITCYGPKGFADVVQQEIQSQLSTAEPFRGLLKDKAYSYMNDKVKDLFKDLKMPATLYQSPVINSEFAITELEKVIPQGLFFKGSISTAISGSRQDPVVRMIPEEIWLENLDQEKPWIFLPQAGVQQVINKVASRPEWITTSLNAVAGFRKLLKSRFRQFFIWPDLWNFKKNATFTLMSTAVTPPTLQLARDSSSTGKFQADLQSWVYANRDEEVVRYLSVRTQVKGEVSVEIADSNLVLNWSNAEIKPKIQMDAGYVKKYRPSTRIAEGILSLAVNSSLSKGQFSIQIPAIKLTDISVAKANSIRKVEPEVFAIDFNVDNIPAP